MLQRKEKKMKAQQTKWEKIVTNLISDKGLAFRIYKQLIQLKRIRQIIQFKNENRI